MGLLRNHLDGLHDVVVVALRPHADDVIFGDQLRHWAGAGRLRLVERYTEAEGILGPAHLDELVPDWRERETWACGPIGLLDAMESHWAEQCLAKRLHTERFRSALITEGKAVPSRSAAKGVVEADGATPILDVGEHAGVLMPSGCRMGICFGCLVPLSRGVVRDPRDGN